MPNQYVNKIVQSNGTTLIDLTGDTVTLPEHIMQGFIGHLADGSQVTGTGQGGSILTTKSITANGTYDASSDNVDGYSSVTVNVPHVGPYFDLIGQATLTLPEYTNTSTVENNNTRINIKNTDYTHILTVVTCDGTKTNAKDWGGLTVCLGSRNLNGTYYNIGSIQSRDNTLSFSNMTNGVYNKNYGCYLQNASNTIQLNRKAHATECPKLMAGAYTVKVYGITAL